ncbi:hypothetical protein [Dactylosporangium sp. CA-233914]
MWAALGAGLKLLMLTDDDGTCAIRDAVAWCSWGYSKRRTAEVLEVC